MAPLQCNGPINLLELQFNDLRDMNTLLQTNKQATRVRRVAPFAGVGWLGHALFGIMDADSAEKIEQQIAECQQNYNYQSQLIKEQTSVINLTANLMKESQAIIDKKFNNLSQAIMQLSNETDLLRKRDQLLNWAFQLSLIINRLEKTQHNILNMLTDLQQGHISSYLFTPAQFKRELEKMNDHIPDDQKLPINPQDDMAAFYEIMRGQMRVTKKNVLIQIHLPLVSIEEFQVYHLIPVPSQHNNEHICIIPESSYLLITLKRNLFYQMNENELNKCIKPHGTTLICPSTRPLHDMESEKSKCERDLLAGQRDFTNCRIKAAPTEEAWIPLQSENEWIYVLKANTIVHVVKSNKMDTVTLQGSGMLHLQPGCEISHNGVTIIGKSSITTTNQLDFVPLVNLSNFVMENVAKLNILNITVTNSDKFDEIHSKVDKIMTTTPPRHDVQHWIHHSLTICLLIGALMALLYKYRHDINNCWTRWRSNSPVASQNGEHDEHGDPPACHHGPGGCPFRT